MIISDASPLIILARVAALDILPRLFTQVAIPHTVWREVTVLGRGRPGAQEVGAAEWIVKNHVKQRLSSRRGLRAGELDAIALALEIEAEALLIDERPGRRLAKELGIVTLGTLDVILKAGRQGIVENPEELILQIEGAGFYMARSLKQDALAAARRVIGQE